MTSLSSIDVYRYLKKFCYRKNFAYFFLILQLEIFKICLHTTIMVNTPGASDESDGETLRLIGPMTIEQFVAQFQAERIHAPVTVCQILFLIIHYNF